MDGPVSSANLAYYPITILYVAPGNQSETDYMSGSSTGTQTSIQNAFKAGIQGGSTGTLAVQAGYSVQSTTGSSFEVDKESSTTLSLSSQADPLDHGKDEFVLWSNPEVDAHQVSATDAEMSLRPQGGTMHVVRLNLGEVRALANTRTSDPFRASLPQWKKDAIAKITVADFTQLLTLHPQGVHANAALDGNRFQLVESLQLDGPDQPNDPVPGLSLEVTNTTIQGTMSQTMASVTVSVTVTTGFNLFGVIGGGGSIGGNFEYDITNATQTTNSRSQQATVKLQTTTPGYHRVVDVYFDSLFKSFLYVEEGQSVLTANAASIAGQIQAVGGKPLGGQIVTVTLPNGQHRRVATDSHGNYRVFGLGAGKHTIIAGGATHEATLTAGVPYKVPQPHVK
jgi:hypothetical protein